MFCFSVFLFLTLIFPQKIFSQTFNDFLSDYKITENQKIDSLENIFSQNNKINFTAYLPAVSYNLLDKDFRITYSVNLKQNAVNNLAMKVDRLAERYDNINTSFTDLLSQFITHHLFKPFCVLPCFVCYSTFHTRYTIFSLFGFHSLVTRSFLLPPNPDKEVATLRILLGANRCLEFMHACQSLALIASVTIFAPTHKLPHKAKIPPYAAVTQ